MAAWAAGRGDRFKAAVMCAGISDWAMLAGTGDWGAQDGALAGGYGWQGPGSLPHQGYSPISAPGNIGTAVATENDHGRLAHRLKAPLGFAERSPGRYRCWLRSASCRWCF
nr:hypothetical protein OG999_08605 [Streptomyces sp. NBC_00886]